MPDPMTLIMLGLIGLLIIFMVRNGRKRREQMAQMHAGIVPGAEVMLQSGIFGTIEHIDEDDENRVTLLSGGTTFVVHRNAIGTIVQPSAEEDIAPDDDPTFGERIEGDDPSNDDQDGPSEPNRP